MKHVSLAGLELQQAVEEQTEIGFAEVMKHHAMNPRIGAGKASKIMIEIVMSPSQQRGRFTTTVRKKVDFAKPDSDVYEGRVFVRTDDEGNVIEAMDQDPRQLRMPLDDAIR